MDSSITIQNRVVIIIPSVLLALISCLLLINRGTTIIVDLSEYKNTLTTTVTDNNQQALAIDEKNQLVRIPAKFGMHSLKITSAGYKPTTLNVQTWGLSKKIKPILVNEEASETAIAILSANSIPGTIDRADYYVNNLWIVFNTRESSRFLAAYYNRMDAKWVVINYGSNDSSVEGVADQGEVVTPSEILELIK